MKNSYPLQFVLILGFVGMTGLYFNEEIQELAFSGAEQEPVVAIVHSIEGQIFRKPYDMLGWVAARANSELRSGDFVKTDSRSTAVLEFANSNKSKVMLAQDSAVRISSTRNRIHILLTNGRVQKLQNESNDIVLLDSQQKEMSLDGPKKLNPNSIEKSESARQGVGEKVEFAVAETAVSSSVYPQDGVVLFSRGSFASIRIRTAKDCRRGCQVNVVFDEQAPMILQIVEGAEILVARPRGFEGRVRWSVIEGSAVSNYHFFIYNYSKEAISRALAENRNIEILP